MKQLNTSKTFLGTFEVVDSELMISDPCYGRDTWCCGIINEVLPGTWNTFVVSGETSWGRRIWELIVLKADNLMPVFKEKSDIHVGVDSGMAGIYNNSSYLGGDRDSEKGKAWWEKCCDVSDGSPPAGVFEGGCVSMSGYGDGGYDCFIDRNNDGKVIGVKIVFISKQEEMEN